jgi:hypothetical protein
VIREDGIAGVRLLLSPKQVWGRPRPAGPPRLRVEFLLGGKRLLVWSIATTDPAERTRSGVGVGDPEARVRTYAPYCRSETRRRFCSTTHEGGVGGTVFDLRHGRAARVTVYAPVF